MAVVEFRDLAFCEENGSVKVTFLNIYFFSLSSKELSEIGDYKVMDHSIEFDCPEKRANSRFNALLKKGFERLRCSIGSLKAVYVHKNSGIPLIGEGVFGLIDRNTNCIEVKPLTCCNLNCIFCSVDAGLSTRKITDYVVEEEYLVEEFNKLAKNKKHGLEAHIGPQGEPLLYAPLLDLIKDLRMNKMVKVISIDTNGTLLTRKLIDNLAAAGLTRLNISLQSMDEKKSSFLAGKPYKHKHVLEMIDYASKKMNVLIAPVIVPCLNDDQLEALVAHSKHLKSEYPTIGVQNFLNYKRGRNPAKQRSWEDFFRILEELEKKEGIKLRLSKDDFGIVPDTKLEKPIKKRDVIKAQIVCDGPEKDEKIAAYKGRAIIVEGAGKAAAGTVAKILIIRDKHNIFRGIIQ